MRALFVFVNIVLAFSSIAQGEVDTGSSTVSNFPSFFSMQQLALTPDDSLSLRRLRTKRWISCGTSAFVVGYSTYKNAALWYNGQDAVPFHWSTDFKDWLAVDKFGHAWTAYQLSRYLSHLWRWADLSDKKSMLVGTALSMGYMTAVELADSRRRFGFSIGDYVADLMGAGLFTVQDMVFHEQRISYKSSSHKRKYPGDIRERVEDIYGASLSNRLFRDYNAQTFWTSFNLKSLFGAKWAPQWLNISIGYGADGMFGAKDNTDYNENGDKVFDRSDIRRYSQLYFSPDIDLTKIKVKSKAARTILFVLNSIKFPAPSVEFGRGKFKWHWIYF